MSQVEILRIIDASGESKSEPGDSDRVAVHDGTTLCVRPPRSTAMIPQRSLTPMIGRDNVVLPDVLDQRLVLLREPQSARSRGYRLLRHRLLSRDNPRVVVVTSAVAGEGTTTCAVNLTLAMAEDTLCRPLLLEANLRHPTLGNIFGFQPRSSIVEEITRSVQGGPPYAVTSIAGTRLHVAALRESLPDTRLDRILLAAALDDLRRVYDYIVIDAPPVLESADIDVVAECSDGAILVTRAGSSRKVLVRRAVEQLAPARVLGTVLLDS